eukprot:1525307-Amphidinium_carterae.1
MALHSLQMLQLKRTELEAWSKLWRPGSVRLRSVVTDDPSAWTSDTIRKIIKRCPAGKARGSDRWGMSPIPQSCGTDGSLA